MKPAVFALFLVLVSCGPRAYLITDPVFVASAPEVVTAWTSLSPWHDAQIVSLGDHGTPDLASVLASLPPGSKVLVGAWVAPDQRAALVGGHRGLTLRFVGPPGGAPSASVSRAQAWATVAAAAASPAPGWAVLPPDVNADEQEAFVHAWTQAGGGPLTVCRWPDTLPLPPSGTLFDWAGPVADPLVAPAVGRRPIHGDPGVPGSWEYPSVHWGVRKSGLGDFLWKITTKSSSNVEFLPLETVWDSR